jgi:hypothetical protein
MFPSGQGGPRRSTAQPDHSTNPNTLLHEPEPVDTAAANAEASRMARQLGLASHPAASTTAEQQSSTSMMSRFRRPTDTAGASYSRMSDASTIPINLESDASPSSYATPALQTGDGVHVFDRHGQQTAYREGPYQMSRDKDGRLVKKRWCTFQTHTRFFRAVSPCSFSH